MKKKFPEHLDDIGTFYKEEFQNFSVDIPEGLWNSIANELNNIPLPEPSSVTPATVNSKTTLTTVVKTKVIHTIKALPIVAKVAAGLALLGGITTTAVYLSKINIVQHEKQSSSTPIITDSLRQTLPDTSIMGNFKDTIRSETHRKVIQLNEGNTHIQMPVQTDSSGNNKPIDIGNKSNPMDIVEPTKEEVPVIPPTELTEPKSLTPEKEPVRQEQKKKNFFQKKLNEQTDSAGAIFKPKQKK